MRPAKHKAKRNERIAPTSGERLHSRSFLFSDRMQLVQKGQWLRESATWRCPRSSVCDAAAACCSSILTRSLREPWKQPIASGALEAAKRRGICTLLTSAVGTGSGRVWAYLQRQPTSESPARQRKQASCIGVELRRSGTGQEHRKRWRRPKRRR